MISKQKISFYKSFHSKKTRQAEQLFIVEGNKMVSELCESSFEIHSMVATKDFINSLAKAPTCEIIETDSENISKISLLQSPQQAWALVKYPKTAILENTNSSLIIALDSIQDPGNLGTILRIADWFGISQIWCSKDCVDVYNPKVVQASMGAIYRVPVIYTDLESAITQSTLPSFSADLIGENIYSTDLPKAGIIVMGNEGNGVSEKVSSITNKKLHIPNFNAGPSSESLNVGVATAIICSEFKRRI